MTKLSKQFLKILFDFENIRTRKRRIKMTEMHILKNSPPLSQLTLLTSRKKGLKMTELQNNSLKSSFPFDFENVMSRTVG